MTEYLLNSAMELAPLEDGEHERFLLRLPVWGRSLEATRYQIGLLEQFESWASPQDVLERYPFERTRSERFIERSIAAGFLLPANANGKPIWPARCYPAKTMLEAPRFDPEAPAGFVFLGAPLDLNTSGAPGARFGPGAVRQAMEGCRYTLDPQDQLPSGFYDFSAGRSLLKGVKLQDAGDVFITPGEDRMDIYDRITQSVAQLTEAGSIPLLIGGDHSITYPALRAFSGPLGLIHFDAHTDLGDIEPGGLHHGNVFSVVLEKLEFVEHIYQFGLRGIIEGGQEAHEKVTCFGMNRLRAETADSLIAHIDKDRPYYLTIDIDVLDPSFAPSTGTPVPCGLFPHELMALIHAITSARQVIGVDVVEVAMPLSLADSTAGLAAQALLTAADGIVQRMLKE